MSKLLEKVAGLGSVGAGIGTGLAAGIGPAIGGAIPGALIGTGIGAASAALSKGKKDRHGRRIAPTKAQKKEMMKRRMIKGALIGGGTGAAVPGLAVGIPMGYIGSQIHKASRGEF